MTRATMWMVIGSAALLAAVAAQAAAPPALVNYQGVLRDGTGAPLSGTFTMEFRFFDAETGGNEILLNQPPPVTVTDGLFNVALGSGTNSDGSGPGTYGSLAEVFRDFEAVYLQIRVELEDLSPRLRILAAPYSLNADQLDGKHAAEFLDTSAAAQTKSGDLGVGDLSVAGLVTISGGSPGPGKVLTSDASGQGSWLDLPGGPERQLLRDLADRLRTADPAELPFADAGSFDCSTTPATLSFSIDGVPTGDVVGFVGRDAISEPFDYLLALENAADIVADTQIGKLGQLTVQRASGSTTYSGRITEFGLAAFDGALRTYVVRLEPALADLRRSLGYGMHQDATLPNVLDSVLSAAGISNVTYDFTGGLPPREMVVQYNETSLDFVSRLNELEGVHYHFRELGGSDHVWFGDHNGAFPLVAGAFSYYGDMQDPGTGEEFVSTFHTRGRRFTGTGTVGAYDFTNPSLTIEQTATVPGGVGEFYEFYAANVDNADASKRAQRLVDGDQVRRREVSGTANAPGFRAGHQFSLTDTTGAGFGGSYIVTGVTHFALRDPDPACIGYGNVFAAIPSTTTYRPPRVTPKPVVRGPITATVTGPPGSTTYTDLQYDRIKVHFPWDRAGAMDETSSGWIRVAPPPGGTDDRRYIPEVGDEVLVTFVQGDPDQPVVIGSMYNDDDLPPANDALVLDDGEIRLDGNGPDGDQTIYFYEAASPTGEYLRWSDAPHRFDLSDDLELSGDLTVAGNDIFFGGGGRLTGTASTTLQVLGNADTDDIFLLPGNSTSDGALRLFGDSTFEMWSGNGAFAFYNGGSSVQTALLDAAGNLQIDGDLTVSGGEATFGPGGSISGVSTALTLTAGDLDTDDLILRAGNSTDDGEISIAGDSTMTLRSGNGFYNLIAGDTGLSAFIDQSDPTINEWTIGGTNLDLFLGDSGADDVFVPGNFSVTGTKNFVQNHPYSDELSIVYTALEGDEAGTYTRGSARLVDGVARVALGETFAWVTNPDTGLTAHVTPRGAWADLYVESVTTTELVVRSAHAGDPDVAFDYVVHGLRIGYEDYGVVQRKRMEGAVPTPGFYDRVYQARPELRAYNAGARFRGMEAALDRARPAEPAAPALRAAIGERDPGLETAAPGDEETRLAEIEAAPVDAPPAPERDPGAGPAEGPPLPAVTAGDAAVDAELPAVVPLDEQGHAYARSFRTVDAELAALVEVTEEVRLGDLLVVDREDPSRLRPATREADPAVVGIVSGRPGVLLGGADDEPGDAAADPGAEARPARAAVAFSGIVLANVDAGFGAIRVGDLLASSPTAGHAMRVTDPRPGTIVGKALEPLESGTGQIRVLVMPR